MCKLFGLLSAAAMLAAVFSSSAQAWIIAATARTANYDAGVCVSNYGPKSGCPYGYHLGWNVRRCVSN